MSLAPARFTIPLSLMLLSAALAAAAPRVSASRESDSDRDEDRVAIESAPATSTPTPAVMARSRLGISIQTLDGNLADALGLKPEQGALVTAVNADGPGSEAGLKRGDVILRVEDAVVKDAEGLIAALAKIKSGHEADLTVQRGIKTLELTVTPGRYLEPRTPKPGDDDDGDRVLPGRERLGLKVADPDNRLRRRYGIGPGDGVVVLSVEEGGRGQAAGLREGDFLLEADRHALNSTRELLAAVAHGRKRGRMALLVKRGDEVFYAAVRFTGA